MRVRNLILGLVVAVSCAAGAAAPASAQREPVIVIPGKPGVPVIIDGRPAAGAIVFGDWGLDRPGHVAPTVIYRQPVVLYRQPLVAPPCYCRVRKVVRPYRRKRVAVVRRKVAPTPVWVHFFPGGTSAPKLGRLESDGPFEKPPPAESFSRSWSSRSSPAPATIPQAPVAMPPVIVDDRPRPKPKPKP